MTRRRLQRCGAFEPGFERVGLGGHQAVIDRDDVLPASQQAQDIGQPEIGIDEIILAGNGSVEALDGLLGVAGISKRSG
jgi:hypothetical protein